MKIDWMKRVCLLLGIILIALNSHHFGQECLGYVIGFGVIFGLNRFLGCSDLGRFSEKEQEFLCHIAFSTCLLSGSLAFLNLMAWIGLETESVVFLVLMGLNRLMIGLIGLQGSTRLLIETGIFVGYSDSKGRLHRFDHE